MNGKTHGRKRAGRHPHPIGYSGKFQRGEHVIVTPSKIVLTPCTQLAMETLSPALIHSSSPGRGLS